MPGVGVISVANQRQLLATQQLEQLGQVTGQVVGSVFYGTLLKQARNSSLQGTYGHGGRGEEVFQAQLHQVLAERAGQANGFDVAEVMFDRFARRVTALAGQQADPVGETGDKS